HSTRPDQKIGPGGIRPKYRPDETNIFGSNWNSCRTNFDYAQVTHSFIQHVEVGDAVLAKLKLVKNPEIKMFALVEFLAKKQKYGATSPCETSPCETRPCEVIPLKWVSADTKSCKWPLKTVKDANLKRQKYLETSNIDTSDDEPTVGIRKPRKAKFIPNSPVEETLNVNFTFQPLDNSGFASSPESVARVDNFELPIHASALNTEDQFDHQGLLYTTVPITHAVPIIPETDRTIQGTSAVPIAGSHQPKNNVLGKFVYRYIAFEFVGFEYLVLKKLEKLLSNIKDLTIEVRNLKQYGSFNVSDLSIAGLPAFPLQTVDDVNLFDQKCQESDQLMLQAVRLPKGHSNT
ncbi:unnamed protein product, partial [Allacma fusca]